MTDCETYIGDIAVMYIVLVALGVLLGIAISVIGGRR